MKWHELLQVVADVPVFRTGFLAASADSLPALRLQLSRWVKAGKLIQLAKGLYTLAEPYRKVRVHPFVLANAMKKASYVSLQSALAHFGMIPEHVPTVTSVTTQRPQRVETPLGAFAFRRIKKSWFHSYKQVDLGRGQQAFVATPEKALLDLVYLTAGSDSLDLLTELRLQNLERLDLAVLTSLAEAAGSPKLRHAARRIVRLVAEEAGEEL
ncbi:MAG TPA: type IV toxin-antitoxin system AbiEi family antitoxin domain-containing protein [Sedimentisphaerales bacterium]|nr:type IV toxin-antitoxin system AbiEi family antitoxin domain-containing protein [Sedimentisphaerales bacterium]HRS10494.1 type IV toxin-antitoxin system AbiEi family antitoxin domain-containing protein [Sedimentisphaerales bacterium]HRV47282.1 type IV toxin-antitoxin system AbiEi family antitoxin domain-containing protein [Sedimentisphaerales bacterium]